ncbi:hypothetical protein M6B38_237680 [Iris pallida]|uniref:Uncharacterized protein n=1 Tax=Iris pallida TaxID=29817 RepID=A0AAX6DMB0_IRIPA|nr:hypothetical protein M6B38_237680 [Iris pallida]
MSNYRPASRPKSEPSLTLTANDSISTSSFQPPSICGLDPDQPNFPDTRHSQYNSLCRSCPRVYHRKGKCQTVSGPVCPCPSHLIPLYSTTSHRHFDGNPHNSIHQHQHHTTTPPPHQQKLPTPNTIYHRVRPSRSSFSNHAY